MEFSCKAKIDDSHGRTRLEWAYSSEEPSTRVAVPVTGSRELDSAPTTQQTKGSPGIPSTGSGAQSEYYDLSALDELPPVRAVHIDPTGVSEQRNSQILLKVFQATREKLRVCLIAQNTAR